jgi:hypothetical protein
MTQLNVKTCLLCCTFDIEKLTQYVLTDKNDVIPITDFHKRAVEELVGVYTDLEPEWVINSLTGVLVENDVLKLIYSCTVPFQNTNLLDGKWTTIDKIDRRMVNLIGGMSDMDTKAIVKSKIYE